MTVCAAPLRCPGHTFTSKEGKTLLTIELPSLESLAGVDLDIGVSQIRLALPGCQERLLIPLPCDAPGDREDLCAKFSRKRRELTITWESPKSYEHSAAAETLAHPEKSPPLQAREPAPRSVTESPMHDGPIRGLVPGEPAGRAAAGVSPGLATVAPPSPSTAELGWTLVERGPPGEPQEPTCCLGHLQSEVENALKQCTVDRLRNLADLGGCSILLGGFRADGEAFAEGQTCRFDISVTFTWETLDAFGGFLGVSGMGKVQQLTAQEPPPRPSIRAAAGVGPRGRPIVEWMRERGASAIAESLSGSALASNVVEALAVEASEMSSKRKASRGQVAKIQSPEALGLWVRAWFEERLPLLSVRLFGGLATASFTNPQVRGDFALLAACGSRASQSGLHLECAWVIASQGGRAEGKLLVSGLSPELGAEKAILEVETTPGKKAPGQLLSAFRQIGVPQVRTLLSRFLVELRCHA